MTTKLNKTQKELVETAINAKGAGNGLVHVIWAVGKRSFGLRKLSQARKLVRMGIMEELGTDNRVTSFKLIKVP